MKNKNLITNNGFTYLYWLSQNLIKVSMSVTSFIALMAFILLALVASIPLYERYKEYPKWKRFLITSSVILLFVIGGLDVYFRTTDNTLERIANSLEKLLKPKPTIKTQPKTDAVYKQNTPQVNNSNHYALLRFSSPNGFMPTLSKTNKEDSLLIDFKLINYGTGQAYDLKLSTIMVWVYNGKVIISKKKVNSLFGKSVIIYPSKTEGQSGTTAITLSKPFIDSTYYCFKIDFSDSTKKRKSFSGIFQLNPDHQYLNVVEVALDRNIRQNLIKEKIWKPPFTQ